MPLSTLSKAGHYLGRRAALRVLPWAWPFYAGIGAYKAIQHELSQRERARLKNLAQKSLREPTRLSKRERGELRRILSKLSPFTFGHFIAAEASPLPWPRPPSSGDRRGS